MFCITTGNNCTLVNNTPRAFRYSYFPENRRFIKSYAKLRYIRTVSDQIEMSNVNIFHGANASI